MANTTASAPQARSHRRTSARGLPSMSERQLDAYLQARDTLRRVRAVVSLTAQVPRERPPSASAT
jgi:hypothetical protein